MINDCYPLESSPDFLDFEFVSVRSKGFIKKAIRYREINVKGIYNLGFGDIETDSGFVNDLIVTNNGDSDQVLATVVKTAYLFTEKYPTATIIATGSTAARTRLYRMGITGNLAAIEKDFELLGLTEHDWESFRKNIRYHAFAVRWKL